MSKYTIESRLWVGSESGMFLGEGRVELLESIQEHGSISMAAKSMGMSYKKAWRLVDEMNKNSNAPLVHQQVGGKGGGGTNISETGIKAIQTFQKLKKKHLKYLKSQETWLNAQL